MVHHMIGLDMTYNMLKKRAIMLRVSCSYARLKIAQHAYCAKAYLAPIEGSVNSNHQEFLVVL